MSLAAAVGLALGAGLAGLLLGWIASESTAAAAHYWRTRND